MESLARESHGPLFTLAMVLAIELFARFGPYSDELYAAVTVVLLVAVVVPALRDGVRPGLVSAAIVVLYNAYFLSIPGRPLRFEAADLRRALAIGIVLPPLAFVVGYLRERVDQLLSRERWLREEAEEARDEARQAAGQFAFLAEASSILASSLDYEKTLQSVAHLAVPSLADWCVVDVVEEDGRAHRVAAAAQDPKTEEVLRELGRRSPPDSSVPKGVLRVLRMGKPALYRVASDAALTAEFRDPRYLHVLRELGVGSIMILPLVARGDTLGAITLVMAESGRRYDTDDLALAEELARRAALAVDNARLYMEAQAASRAKSDFLAVMSHELRTPLNAIMGYSDLLQSGISGPLVEQQRLHVGRIGTNARHLLGLVEEILTLSRMEAEREKVRLAEVELGALVRDVAAVMEPLARERGLDFHLDAPAEPRPVETDPGKLRQILAYLLSNAVKFTERGEIGVSAGVEGGEIVLRVRDTGVGIAAEYLERIFEPFTQVEEAMTREKGGTGLGLSVARRLARMMGGEVSVESEPGSGSTFTVRLPVRGRGPEIPT